MPAERVDEEAGGAASDIPTNFGWLVKDRVAGMAMPTSFLQLAHLRQQFGVDVVINLLPLDLHRRGAQLLGDHYEQRPEQESGQLERIVIEMRRAAANGQVVAVHCCGGLGRTGVVLACYLVAAKGISAHEAIRMVRDKRPQSVVCRKQELAVHRFETYLDDKNGGRGLARHRPSKRQRTSREKQHQSDD